MLEFLPVEIREGLRAAQMRGPSRKRRLSLHQGDMVFAIRRMWNGGFSLTVQDITQLRGRVEIYEGPRHILTCLIQATDIEGDEVICSFKRASPVRDRAPLDYVAKDEVWYLPRD